MDDPTGAALHWVFTFALVGFCIVFFGGSYLRENYYTDTPEACERGTGGARNCDHGDAPLPVQQPLPTALFVSLLAGVVGWFVGITIPRDSL